MKDTQVAMRRGGGTGDWWSAGAGPDADRRIRHDPPRDAGFGVLFLAGLYLLSSSMWSPTWITVFVMAMSGWCACAARFVVTQRALVTATRTMSAISLFVFALNVAVALAGAGVERVELARLAPLLAIPAAVALGFRGDAGLPVSPGLRATATFLVVAIAGVGLVFRVREEYLFLALLFLLFLLSFMGVAADVNLLGATRRVLDRGYRHHGSGLAVCAQERGVLGRVRRLPPGEELDLLPGRPMRGELAWLVTLLADLSDTSESSVHGADLLRGIPGRVR